MARERDPESLIARGVEEANGAVHSWVYLFSTLPPAASQARHPPAMEWTLV